MLKKDTDHTPLKAALYVRLSNEDRNKLRKDDDSESIVNQQNMLSSYCADHGIEVYKVYNDEDFKGSDPERPAFKQMIQDAKDGKFNMILSKTQARFARDSSIVDKYINYYFPIWNIRFLSLVDNSDSANKHNRKQRQILSLVDQWYLEDLSDNVKATLASKRKRGLWVGAFAPYGYIKDPNDKNHLIVDEEAAGIVRTIFDLYLQGCGITPIARKLNELGIPNPATYKQQHGQPFQNKNKECSNLWHTYSIGRILSNPVYRGYVVQGMAENVSYKSTKKRRKPKEEWDIVANMHEAIIDQDTWEKVQRLRNSKPKPGNFGNPNIFAGKIKCLNCGGAMRVYYTHHDRYFRCLTNYYAIGRCLGTYVSEKVIREEVLRQIRQLYQQYIDEMYLSENLTGKIGYEDKINTLKSKIRKAEQSIEKLENRLKSLYIDKLDGLITKNDFLMYTQETKTAKKALEQDLEAFQKEIEDYTSRMNNAKNRLEIINRFKDIQELDRLTVCTLIDYIEIGGSKSHRIINIYWNF